MLTPSRHRMILRLSHARRLMASRRSHAADRRLALTLAFIAGDLNAGGFMLVGQYTSHMSGIVSALADNLAIGAGLAVAAGASALCAFGVGAGVSAILINWMRRRGSHTPYASPLLLEAGLLGVFAVAGACIPASVLLPALAIPLLCFIMGLQNATITKVSGARMRTTHMTGIVTDIGIELGKMSYWNRKADAAPAVQADMPKLKLLASLLGCFFAGGLVGAFSFTLTGPIAALPLAAILVGLSLAPLLEAALVRRHVTLR